VIPDFFTDLVPTNMNEINIPTGHKSDSAYEIEIRFLANKNLA